MDSEKEIDPMIAKLIAENLGLKMLLSHLIARLANDYGDQDHYVLTLTSDLRTIAEQPTNGDTAALHIGAVLSDLADYFEARALGE